MAVAVMRAENFHDGEPISLDIGSVTAEKRVTPGNIHVISSKVPRLRRRLDCGDTLSAQFQKRRA